MDIKLKKIEIIDPDNARGIRLHQLFYNMYFHPEMIDYNKESQTDVSVCQNGIDRLNTYGFNVKESEWRSEETGKVCDIITEDGCIIDLKFGKENKEDLKQVWEYKNIFNASKVFLLYCRPQYATLYEVREEDELGLASKKPDFDSQEASGVYLDLYFKECQKIGNSEVLWADYAKNNLVQKFNFPGISSVSDIRQSMIDSGLFEKELLDRSRGAVVKLKGLDAITIENNNSVNIVINQDIL